MAGDVNPKDLLARSNTMEAEKSNWNTMWQLIGDYVIPRRGEFTEKREAGEFLRDDIFDITGAVANRDAAAAFLGMVFPDASKSFKLTLTEDLQKDKKAQDWIEKATKTLIRAMDDPKAGLVSSLDEFMQDDLAFGTAGLFIGEGAEGESLLDFQAWSVMNMSISEGAGGYVNTIFKKEEPTIRQLVEEYGAEAVSKKVREQWVKGSDNLEQKIKILKVIEPRDITPQLPTPENLVLSTELPFRYVVLEEDGAHVIEESGFFEFPCPVSRFRKAITEKYGRGPGSEAIHDILQLNAMAESTMLAMEYSLNPALAVIDDGSLGGETIDLSPKAVNVFKQPGGRASGQIGSPVVPLFSVGDFNPSLELRQELINNVTKHYYLDRLLDFNNQTQMTAREASLRFAIRNSTLRSPVDRLTFEVLNPMIQRCFNILFRKGVFGVMPGSNEEAQAATVGVEVDVIPDSVAEAIRAGQEAYEIKYTTPSARQKDEEELEGIYRLLDLTVSVAQIDPAVIDKLDTDAMIDRGSEIMGVPASVLLSEEELQAKREQRAQQQQVAAVAASAAGPEQGV